MAIRRERVLTSNGIEIPLNLIRIQQTEYPTEIWGLVCLDGFPFYFRRSRSYGLRSDSGFDIHGKEFNVSWVMRSTKWWNHAPYRPFTPSPKPDFSEFFSPPVRTDSITDSDLEFVLSRLKLSAGPHIVKASSQTSLINLYRQVVSCDEVVATYGPIFNKYFGSEQFSEAIETASGIILEEKGFGNEKGVIRILSRKVHISNYPPADI